MKNCWRRRLSPEPIVVPKRTVSTHCTVANLALTPWQRGKPLPIGPLHLVPQDACVLGLLVAAMHDPQLGRCSPVSLFLLGYLGQLAVSFLSVGMRGFGYGLAFALGLVVAADVHTPLALAVCLPIAAVANVGLRRQLDRFPWHSEPLWGEIDKLLARRKRTVGLGWPFDHLQPQVANLRIGYGDGVLLSLLIGWWLFALLVNNPVALRSGGYLLYAYLLSVAVLRRLAIYCWHYRPPISLWGRLWTLRWIIPGYDRVLLAPLGTVLMGIAAPLTLETFNRLNGTNLPVAPISLSLVLLTAINSGPTFETWRLTGNHRIVPAVLNQQEYQQL